MTPRKRVVHFTMADLQLRRERMAALLTKHGHAAGTRSGTYRAWVDMHGRCTRPSHRSYRWYGAQAVSVCARWKKFENFLADMGDRPPSMTLDRYPSKNGNYEPGNCRWATAQQQQNNRRSNVRVRFRGRDLTAAELAREFGLKPKLVQERLRRGVRPEDVVLPPTDSKFRSHRS